MRLPDVHRYKPAVALPLRKVGIKGIRMPISFTTLGGKRVLLVPVFDVFIDLPPHRKGIDASRSYEAVADVFGMFAKRTFKLEDLCAHISNELLRRHEYATRAEVKARAEAVVERTTPSSGITTFEPYRVYAKAVSKMVNGVAATSRMVGVKVVGVTACPCVSEGLKAMSRAELADLLKLHGLDDSLIDSLPIATHMQRSEGFLAMDSPEGYDVDVSRLIDIVEGAMSAPTYELLKRLDELDIVLKAIKTPRFVEDSIRFMAKGVVEEFKDLPDDVKVFMAQRSEESIHKHDMVAIRRTTMGELRKEILNQAS
ncbi:MAG: GTP cyclohydrolase I FolE2 [Thermoprotei archaeon]|nr:MAG: GTP cyclohydrolase I FolE2 [Thermoprotei archaeon]